MDYSQYLRLKQEAANIYLARNKTVDSSFLSLQKKQKAAYGNVPMNITKIYDAGHCPVNHEITDGFTDTNKLSQQEDRASRLAGATLCCEPSYTDTPNVMRLKSCDEINTILNSYDNNAFVPVIRSCVLPLPLPVPIPDMNSMRFNGNSFLQLDGDSTIGPITSSDFTIEFNLKISSPGLQSTQVLFYIGQEGVYDKLIASIVPGRIVDKIRPENTCCSSKAPEKVQGYTFGINFGSDIYAVNADPAKSPTVFGDSNIQPDIWYYFAIVRNGSTLTIYQNGRIIGQLNGITDTQDAGYYLETELIIGGRYNSSNSLAYLTNGFNGYISNFRWTKQQALYTKNFIMPLPPFTVYNSRTRLLITGNRSIQDDSALGQAVNNSSGLPVNGDAGSGYYYDQVVNTVMYLI